jgi:predicted P-loop ATPase
MTANYLKKVDEILARALTKKPTEDPEPIVSSKAKSKNLDKRDTPTSISKTAPAPEHPAPKTKKRPKTPPPKLGVIEKIELGFPETTAAGKIKNTCENARHAIKLLGVRCEYDEFHDKLIIGGQTFGQYAGELSDHACLFLRKMIEENYDFDPGRERMFDACAQLALENRFDPAVDYLSGLQWDGVGRVDTWLMDYFGAEDTELNRAIGRIALVAQVRRARQPGCKFDQILVLESPEGYFKSTALSVLAGAPENFSDQTILGKSDKEQQELLRGIWVYEIADLSNIRIAEVEHVKAFASRTHDRARPAYGRARIDLPRRCIIWATTNNAEYLKSQSGNRRFWPVPVKVIDIEALKRDRDQLFAEAVILDDDGTSIVLPQNLWDAAAAEQEQRREADPWEDVLRDVEGEPVGNEYRVLSRKVLEINIGPKAQQTPTHTHRVGICMRHLGWNGPKQMRIGDQSGKGYWR